MMPFEAMFDLHAYDERDDLSAAGSYGGDFPPKFILYRGRLHELRFVVDGHFVIYAPIAEDDFRNLD